jgi:hypothetical protein
MPRFMYAILASPILFASGCLIPYWVSPSVSYVPAARVNTPAETVHAFRVDTRQSAVYPDITLRLRDSYELTPISLNANAEVPAQSCVSCTRGFLALFVAVNYRTWHQETLSVRLYQRGYETVELKSWDFATQVVWQKAETLAAQGKAIDDLVAGNLEACGIANGHRAALLFAADEYDRLAAAITGDDGRALGQRQIWQEKAERLRRQAAEKYDRGVLDRLLD